VRIAIPMSGDCLEQHFGHCEGFVFFDVDSETKQIGGTAEEKAPEHQPGLLPRWLKERGVTLIIAGGMGTHARSLCEELSIKVVTGAPSEAAQALVKSYLNDTLVIVDHVCEHH
jgi:predicted Fe-Mo cluster-binding NifX family protein